MPILVNTVSRIEISGLKNDPGEGKFLSDLSW